MITFETKIFNRLPRCFVAFVLLVAIGLSCAQEDIKVLTDDVVYSKNEQSIDINGVMRDFVFHVPDTYDGRVEVPILFMLHGSSGNGEQFYNISRWREKADEEGFIAVFPTGLEYRIADTNRYVTKWSSDGLEKDVDDGVEIVDDIPFFRQLIQWFEQRFLLDSKRRYICGFSNGGSFVRSRVIPEMADVFAAAATSGGLGLPEAKTISFPFKTPLYVMLGTRDEAIIKAIGEMSELPIKGEDIMDHGLIRQQINGMLETLGLSSEYREIPNIPVSNTLIFDQPITGGNTAYHIMMVKDMKHVFANETNNDHKLVAADVLWDWMKDKKRP